MIAAMKRENIVSITELRRDAAGLVKRATDQQSPIFITQNGRVTAVLRDPHSYNREREKMAMLVLAMQGERDIREGRVISHAESRKRIKAILERARVRAKSR
jgi:prevent-host-death family protein